jgi:hypothetical protein
MRRGDTAIPAEMCGLQTARELVRRGDTAMLRYLIYAKHCEDVAYTAPDSWHWHNEQSVYPANYALLIDRGRAEYATCSDNRLRLRYGYQLVRLAHYGGFREQAVQMYDSMVAANPTSSIIRYYAMLQQAGVRAKDGAMPAALYLLAQVFDHHAGGRWTALHDFNIDSSSMWDSTYAMAQNNHERSVLWMMRGLTEYQLDTKPMEEMVRLEPHNPRLDVMLLREVREVERRLYSERVTRPAKLRRAAGFEYVDWTWASSWLDSADDRRYPTRLARFVERCADRKMVANRALWYGVAGYMRIIDGDLATAVRDLEKADNLVQDNEELIRQILALRLLVQIRSSNHLSARTASLYTDALKWIGNYRSDVRPYAPEMVLLGQKFLKQGDVPRAAAAFAAGGHYIPMDAVLDIYATDTDLLQLQHLIASPGKRHLDTMLFNSFPLSQIEILDLRATRMMRRGRFADAVRFWDELDTLKPQRRTALDTLTVATMLERGAFEAVIDSTLPAEMSENWEPKERTMTRPAFAREMLRLQHLVRRSGADAERYNYTIARALNSTSMWGYSDQVWNGSLVLVIRYFYSPAKFPFNVSPITDRMVQASNTFLREYGSNRLAWHYFDQTRRITSDRELAAQCAFDMDEALKNPQTSYHPHPEKQDRTGYNLLRTRYRDTDFAEHILSNCGTYEWFTTHQ